MQGIEGIYQDVAKIVYYKTFFGKGVSVCIALR